ncbi:MAG: ketoacyl-ACP synthase III [Chloroflexi bacterium]|nr:ketoacyl-ACP synthase III [Chloroflexota bacterium]
MPSGIDIEQRESEQNSVQRGVRIAGWGKAIPERVLTNADMEKIVDTSDEWITTRTGIKERHIVEDHESTSTLALVAARAALKCADATGADVQLIICATATPDYQFPSVACLLQSALGSAAAAFDIQAACSGFLYGLITASQFLVTGLYDSALVVGAETLSRITDWTDRSTCVLFGDGAGAVYLEATEAPGDIRASWLGADGSNPTYLYMDGPARSQQPTILSPSPSCSHLSPLPPSSRYIKMDGREVFRFSTRICGEAIQNVVQKAGWSIEDLALIIPHQANYRIILSASNFLGIPIDRFYLNVQRYGNTSAASIPIALAEAIEEGKLQPGQKTVLVAFGGGLTWAAIALEWSTPISQRPDSTL